MPQLSEAKLKEGVCYGPQIRTRFRNTAFVSIINQLEKDSSLNFF